MKSLPVALCLLLIAAALLPHGATAQVDVGRPAPEAGPTRVEVIILILDVNAVTAASQSFTANVYFGATWHDPRLAHDGSGPVSRSLDQVWHPRLQILNQRRVHNTMARQVEITPDGQVTYQQRVWGEFSQPLDLRDFPFDHQDFAIQLVAARHSPAEIVLVDNSTLPSGISETVSLPDWEILGSKVDTETYRVFPEAPGSASFTVYFTAKRNISYSILKIILPLILIVMMSWSVFWLDPDIAGPQISAAVTAMLTLIAYRFMIGGMLPQISYLTRLDFFILGSTLLVFATLAEAVATVYLAKQGRKDLARRIDRWSRLAVPLIFAGLFLIALVF